MVYPTVIGWMNSVCICVRTYLFPQGHFAWMLSYALKRGVQARIFHVPNRQNEMAQYEKESFQLLWGTFYTKLHTKAENQLM